MSQLFRNVSLFCFVISWSNLFAVINQIECWQHSTGKRVYLARDVVSNGVVSCRIAETTTQHRDDVIEFAKIKKALLISQDASYNPKTPATQPVALSSFVMTNSVLCGLLPKAMAHNIPVANVEYRFSQFGLPYQSCKSSLAEILGESKAVGSCIKGVQTTPSFEATARDIVKSVGQQRKEIIKSVPNLQAPFKDTLESIKDSHERQRLQSLVGTYDSAFVDLLTAQAVYQAGRTHNAVVVVNRSCRIESLAPYLRILDFKPIHHVNMHEPVHTLFKHEEIAAMQKPLDDTSSSSKSPFRFEDSPHRMLSFSTDDEDTVIASPSASSSDESLTSTIKKG